MTVATRSFAAHVVLVEGQAGDDAKRKMLQEHVKASLAPYRYPRAVFFLDALPKTQTEKIQRLRLKRHRWSDRQHAIGWRLQPGAFRAVLALESPRPAALTVCSPAGQSPRCGGSGLWQKPRRP